MNNDLLKRIFINKTKDTKIQFLRYIFVGGISAVVNILALYVFTEIFSIYYLISNGIGFVLGITTNYILSKIFVFSLENSKNRSTEIIIYIIIGILGLGIDSLIMWTTTSLIGVYYILSKVISTAIVFIWNFSIRKMMYLFIDKKEK